jgi:hypothetical protein
MMATKAFLRWSKLGICERSFEAAKTGGWPELGLVFIDGALIPAYQRAA